MCIFTARITDRLDRPATAHALTRLTWYVSRASPVTWWIVRPESAVH